MRALRLRLRNELPSWAAHAAIASAVVVMLTPLLGPWEAWRLAVWGYAFRELDQLLRKWLKPWRQWGTMLELEKRTLGQQWWRWKTATWDWSTSVNWLGAAGDVAAPALVAWLVTLRWLL